MATTLRPLMQRRTPISTLHACTQWQQTRHAQVLPIRFLQTRSAEARVAAKYQDKLQKKLQDEGVESLEELKERYKDKIHAVRKAAAVPEVDVLLEKTGRALPKVADPFTQPPPPPPTPAASEAVAGSGSSIASAARAAAKVPPGVKSLASFVDPHKLAAHEDVKEIEFIWRARFLPDKNSLCAVIPNAVYRRMEESGRQYPMFILPLPREGQGVEMHFLQWTFPTPHSSTIIFTSLADYKLRGEFAVPHTTLTHHLELADSKKLVLAQGAVIQDRGVTVDEAQLLVMALQKFYAAEESHGDGQRRKSMLEQFTRGDSAFKIEKLIEEVETIN